MQFVVPREVASFSRCHSLLVSFTCLAVFEGLLYFQAPRLIDVDRLNVQLIEPVQYGNNYNFTKSSHSEELAATSAPTSDSSKIVIIIIIIR